ncbi:DUF3000 domain-containing protein [Streptomyces sp. NPDC054784]
MAAARTRTAGSTGGTGGPDDGDGSGPPPAFRTAVAALDAVRHRPEVRLSPLPAPKRLAPFAYALEATVEYDEEDLADGRFVLLHDPDGQDSWDGTFRVVTLGRVELDPEMASDPLLPDVTWSWLTGALEGRSVAYGAASGTVTRSGSYFFGGMADRTPQSELEVRASWSPVRPSGRPDAVPDLAPHLAAWCDVLCLCAGLPPGPGEGGAVVPLPQRRGPHPA